MKTCCRVDVESYAIHSWLHQTPGCDERASRLVVKIDFFMPEMDPYRLLRREQSVLRHLYDERMILNPDMGNRIRRRWENSLHSSKIARDVNYATESKITSTLPSINFFSKRINMIFQIPIRNRVVIKQVKFIREWVNVIQPLI